jgi:hypothetical protein
MPTLDLFDDDDDGGATVFRDVIMLALAGFIAIVILVLPHLNPPAKAVEAAAPPGNVIVEIRWPDALDADVDLWVEAPGGVPVGYSNKGGVIFNLLRDDLGNQNDVTEMNYEVSYSRGVPAGEYTVNVHLFRFVGQTAPVPVTVAASVKTAPTESAKRIVASKVELPRQGAEITAFRFTLDDRGDLVAGSVHSLQRALREHRK